MFLKSENSGRKKPKTGPKYRKVYNETKASLVSI